MAQGNKKSNKKPSIPTRLVEYLNGVRVEMRRVVWPGRQEIISSSLIVITTLIVFIVFVLIVDQISSFLIIEQLAKLGR